VDIQEESPMSTSLAKTPLQRSGFFLLAVVLSLGLTDLTVTSATFAAEAHIGESELVSILRATKVVPPDSKLTASISGDEVVITTTKKQGATDAASKIEAVLIAKTVFDSVSNDAQRTKVIFFDFTANTYSEVAVKRAEVKMYGSGQLSEKELLSSIELKTAQADSTEDEAVKVAPGPMQLERIMLSARLMKLERDGSSVKDLRQPFEQLEATAKSGNKAETIKEWKDLSANVAEREIAFRDARKHETSLVAQVQHKEARQHEKYLAAQAQLNGDPSKQATNASGSPSSNGKFTIEDLFLGPDHKTNMYNFGAHDLPRLGDGLADILFLMAEIQKLGTKGKNVKGLISSMNRAIQSHKTHDVIGYQDSLSEVHRQLREQASAQAGNNSQQSHQLRRAF
jgi:hypothetical protein